MQEENISQTGQPYEPEKPSTDQSWDLPAGELLANNNQKRFSDRIGKLNE